jgi:hypothetical protein
MFNSDVNAAVAGFRCFKVVCTMITAATQDRYG